MISHNLTSTKSPWLHILDANVADVYTIALDLNGSREGRALALKVRGEKCRMRQALFDELGAVLQLPAYFGENLDALDECIRDLEWLPADYYILIFTDCDQLLISDQMDGAIKALGQILFRAAQHWNNERGKSFHVIFQGDSRKRISEALKSDHVEFTEFCLKPGALQVEVQHLAEKMLHGENGPQRPDPEHR